MSSTTMKFHEAREALRAYLSKPAGSKTHEVLRGKEEAMKAFGIEYVDNACDTCGRDCPIAYDGNGGVVVASCSFYEYDPESEKGE